MMTAVVAAVVTEAVRMAAVAAVVMAAVAMAVVEAMVMEAAAVARHGGELTPGDGRGW